MVHLVVDGGEWGEAQQQGMLRCLAFFEDDEEALGVF